LDQGKISKKIGICELVAGPHRDMVMLIHTEH
jgi:hypothetical protein